jgi:hypothetical protein
MYGYLPITTDVALNVGAMADVTGAILNFAVEEDEMLVELGASGTLLSGAAASTTDFQFVVDGTATTTLPLGNVTITAAATKGPLGLYQVVRLTKGRHVVKLQANASAATTLKGTAYDCRLVARRDSADAVLAHGVDSKVQLTM